MSDILPDSLIFGKATKRSIELPPQAVSFTFNEAGQVKKFTGGYVLDKTIGNSGGLGGVFGIKYATGKPFFFREAKEFRPSLGLRLFNFLGSIVSKFAKD